MAGNSIVQIADGLTSDEKYARDILAAMELESRPDNIDKTDNWHWSNCWLADHVSPGKKIKGGSFNDSNHKKL